MIFLYLSWKLNPCTSAVKLGQEHVIEQFTTVSCLCSCLSCLVALSSSPTRELVVNFGLRDKNCTERTPRYCREVGWY